MSAHDVSALPAYKPETLEEAIERFVNLGEEDPLTIARKTINALGEETLAHELMAYAEDFVAEFARRKLNSVRRAAEIALRPGDPQTSANLRLAKAWVPANRGQPAHWKRAADLTAEDLRARAHWYRRFAVASVRRAMWCEEVAGMIEAEGVATLGDLRSDLPALPENGMLEELEA